MNVKIFSSILDYPHPGLDPKVWTQDGKLLPEHKDEILSKLNDHLVAAGIRSPEKWITSLHIVGSLTTYQYARDTDVDLHIGIDFDAFCKYEKPSLSKEDAEKFLDELRKEASKEHRFLPDTQHPIEFYFLTPSAKEDTSHVGVYDLYTDKWLKAPVAINSDFDIEQSQPKFIEDAMELAGEIDESLGKIKQHIRRVEDLQDVIKEWSPDKRKSFEKKLQDKLSAIEDEIDNLVKTKKQIQEQRKDIGFDPESEREVKFKYLQKFGYFFIISRLRDLFDAEVEDVKVTEQDVPKIKEIVECPVDVKGSIELDAHNVEKSDPGIGKLMIDFDNTIAVNSHDHQIKALEPGVKEALTKLKADGWHIVIYSGRANSPEGIDEIKDFMAKNALPYDEIFVGKPDAELYIDDRNIVFTDWKDTLKCVEEHEQHSKKSSLSVSAQNGVQYDFTSTHFNMPKEIAQEIVEWSVRNIPDEDLYDDGSGKFERELESHMTILFGLLTNDSSEVEKLLADEKPIRLKFGKTDVFEAPEKDAIFISVESEDAEKLHKKLMQLDNENQQPDYHPHVTVAYVKKGLGKKYAGKYILDNLEIELDTLKFSPKEGDPVFITLGKKQDKEASKSYDITVAYWIAPDGKLYEAEPSHADWVFEHLDFLANNYDIGIAAPEETHNLSEVEIGRLHAHLLDELIDRGWVRVLGVGENINYQISDLHNPPIQVEDFFINHIEGFSRFLVEDMSGDSVLIVEPEFGFVKGIKQALRRGVRHASLNIISSFIEKKAKLHWFTQEGGPIVVDPQSFQLKPEIYKEFLDKGYIAIDDTASTPKVLVWDFETAPEWLNQYLNDTIGYGNIELVDRSGNSFPVHIPTKNLKRQIQRELYPPEEKVAKTSASDVDSKFTHGYCAEYALALSEKLNKPIGAIRGIFYDDESNEYTYQDAHAFVFISDNIGVDAIGERPISDMVKDIFWEEQPDEIDTVKLSPDEIEYSFGETNEEALNEARHIVNTKESKIESSFSPSIATPAPDNAWQTDSDVEIPVDPDTTSEEETSNKDFLVDKPKKGLWQKLMDMFKSDDSKEASLIQSSISRSWISPDNKIFPVKFTHYDWILDNSSLLQQDYGFEVDEVIQELGDDPWGVVDSLVGSGWVRIGDVFNTTDIGIHVPDLSSIPTFVIDYLLKNMPEDAIIWIEDPDNNGVEVTKDDLLNGQDAIDYAVKRRHSFDKSKEASLKKKASAARGWLDPSGKFYSFGNFNYSTWEGVTHDDWAKENETMLYEKYHISLESEENPTTQLIENGWIRISDDFHRLGVYLESLSYIPDFIETHILNTMGGDVPVTVEDLDGVWVEVTDWQSGLARAVQKELQRKRMIERQQPVEGTLKTAYLDHAYWIAPDNKVFVVRGGGRGNDSKYTHGSWAKRNRIKLKQKYDLDIMPDWDTFEATQYMIDAGWIRIGDAQSGRGWAVMKHNIREIPSSVDNLLATFLHDGDTIAVEDLESGDYVEVEYPFKSLQNEVNRQYAAQNQPKPQQDVPIPTPEETPVAPQKVEETASLKIASPVPDILKLVQETGGATYNFTKGNMAGTPTYAVSIYPERSIILNHFPTEEDLTKYIQTNSDLFNDETSLGVWHNKADGKVYLDVVKTLADRDQAIALGKQHNQISIFDLKNFEEIPTGGTGEVPKQSAEDITMPKDEFVKEHEHLLKVLKSPSHKDDLEEYEKQKKELEEYTKRSALGEWAGYWIDPNGDVHEMSEGEEHDDWMTDHDYFDTDKVFDVGWVRARVNEDELLIQVKDLTKIPPFVNDFLSTKDVAVIVIEDYPAKTWVELEYEDAIQNGIQDAVNRAIRQKRLQKASLGLSKYARFDGTAWVDPKGKIFRVGRTHAHWVYEHLDMLEQKYGYSISEGTPETDPELLVRELLEYEWTRVAEWRGGEGYIQIADLEAVPPGLQPFLDENYNWENGGAIVIDDLSGAYVEVEVTGNIQEDIDNSRRLHPGRTVGKTLSRYLEKKAFSAHAWWIAPDKQVYEVRGKETGRDTTHAEWVKENRAMLSRKYKIRLPQRINVDDAFDVNTILIEKGWTRLGDYSGGQIGIRTQDIHRIPSIVDDLLATFATEGERVHVEDTYQNEYASVVYPFKSLQTAVNRDLMEQEQERKKREELREYNRQKEEEELAKNLEEVPLPESVEQPSQPTPSTPVPQPEQLELPLSGKKAYKGPATTWDSTEPFTPLPTTFEWGTNDDNLNFRYPWKFMRKPTGPDTSNEDEVNEMIVDEESPLSKHADESDEWSEAVYGKGFSTGKGYWITPDGRVFEVSMEMDGGVHGNWLIRHWQDLKSKYGIDITKVWDSPPEYWDLIDYFVDRGWVRVSSDYSKGRISYGIYLKDLRHIPSSVDEFIMEHGGVSPENTVILEDINKDSIELNDPEYLAQGLDKSVRRQLNPRQMDLPLSGALSKHALSEFAAWIDPKGKVYHVRSTGHGGTHLGWIEANADLLRDQYGYEIPRNQFLGSNLVIDMFNRLLWDGWIRIGDSMNYNRSISIQVPDLKNIPSYVDDYLSGVYHDGMKVEVEEGGDYKNQGRAVALDNPFPTLQKAVNRALVSKLPLSAALSKYTRLSRVWIAPDGKTFEAGYTHHDWIPDNLDILKSYGLDVSKIEAIQNAGFEPGLSDAEIMRIQEDRYDKIYHLASDLWGEMLDHGWCRVGDSTNGLGMEVGDLRHIPPAAFDYLYKNLGRDETVMIEDGPGQYIQMSVQDLAGGQKSVNRALHSPAHTAALSKHALTMRGYWVAPDGQVFEVRGDGSWDTHGNWVFDNLKMLKKKYGIKSADKNADYFTTAREMLEKGWARIGDTQHGRGVVGIEVANIRNIPSYVDDAVASFATDGELIVVADLNENWAEIRWPVKSIQSAVSRNRGRRASAASKPTPASPAQVDGHISTDGQFYTNEGLTHNQWATKYFKKTSGKLLEEGWMRIAGGGGGGFAAEYSKQPTDAQWKTVEDILFAGPGDYVTIDYWTLPDSVSGALTIFRPVTIKDLDQAGVSLKEYASTLKPWKKIGALLKKRAVSNKEIKDEAYALWQQALEDWEMKVHPIERAIIENGGIASYRPSGETRRVEEREEYRGIPVRLRGTTPYDEMIDRLKSEHLLDQDAGYGDLYEIISNLPQRGHRPQLQDFIEEAKHNLEYQGSLYKKAFQGHAYWIDPNGKVYTVRDSSGGFKTHWDWISQNEDLLSEKYHINAPSSSMAPTDYLYSAMIGEGWTRVGDAGSYGKRWGIEVDDIHRIPSYVDSLLSSFLVDGNEVNVEDASGELARVIYPFKSLQNAVNQDLANEIGTAAQKQAGNESNTYSDEEMEKIYDEQHSDEMKQDEGGGFTPRDFNDSSTDYPKPEDTERKQKIQLDLLEPTQTPPIPSYEVTWYFGSPADENGSM